MIVLDTNVISELLRPTPDATVLRWVASQPRSALYTTAITRAELMYGAQILPEGKRKLALLSILRDVLITDFSGQILAFDNEAADAYAVLSASRKARGRPIEQADAMIAAIASVHSAVLATRNTSDFVDCGVSLINPWNSGRTP